MEQVYSHNVDTYPFHNPLCGPVKGNYIYQSITSFVLYLSPGNHPDPGKVLIVLVTKKGMTLLSMCLWGNEDVIVKGNDIYKVSPILAV